MKDRFSDTSKQIYDNPDFDDIQNAIGQLEEIIRTRTTQRQHELRRAGSSTSTTDQTDKESHSKSPVPFLNNNNIVEKPNGIHSKSNGKSVRIIEDVVEQSVGQASCSPKRNGKRPVIIYPVSNEIKSPYQTKKSSNSVISTTTALLHSPTTEPNDFNCVNDDRRDERIIITNGILKKSSSQRASHDGTATATETTRSGSKTPEITITPGSEPLPETRFLLSSRVSPEDLPDSGCTGLLDEEDEETCSLQRAGSSSTTTAGDQHQSFAVAAGSQTGNVVVKSAGATTSCDRDSGGGSVGSSCGLQYTGTQRSTGNSSEKETIYAEIQRKKSVSEQVNEGVYDTHHQLLKNQPLLHVEGPVDGSPYAVINPLVKHKALLEGSGIPLDQMKDLDRLLTALVQEAESIDIPYHARTDSLPFSYTAPSAQQQSSAPAPKRSPYGSTTLGASRHQSHQQYGTTVQPSTRYRLEHSLSSPGIVTARNQTQQVPQYYHQSVEDQIVNPEPVGYSGRQRQGNSRVGARTMEQYRVRPSLSSTSFNTGYGNGGGATRRLRSQSADGRRDSERDEDADEWLARQMKKLQEKRATKNAPRSDWLAELKRALPAAAAAGSSSGATPSAIAAAASTNTERTYESRPSAPVPGTQNLSEYRPYREELSSVFGSTGARRSQVSYSSEDDDDVELEMLQRSRRIQRHYSESAYDRGMMSSSTSRAPSQLSNVIETPFPTCPPTPYFNRPVSPGKPPRSPKGIRRQVSTGSTVPALQELPSRMERSQTPVNPRPVYMVDSEVKFAQDLSEHWYKPFASREETVSALVSQASGAFLIRNSNSFPGAFGLAVKVTETAGEKGIRHFLIEPTRFGVRLRGSPLEPVFSSLSALVYAHSVDPLALPTTLSLPSFDILPKSSQSTTALLLRQGAACQLLFLGMTNVECLTGDEAIHRGISQIVSKSPIPISLRLSRHGLTLTDVFRKQFFRLHFALTDISYASLVPGRSVAYGNEVKQVFAVVARAPRATENSVIVLAELEHGQPANAIVSFILRVIAWQH